MMTFLKNELKKMAFQRKNVSGFSVLTSSRKQSSTSNSSSIIRCRKIAEDVNLQVKRKINEKVMRGGKRPVLNLIICESQPVARAYGKLILKNCHNVGIQTSVRCINPSTTTKDLHDVLVKIGYDNYIDASLIVFPIHKSILLDQIHIGLDLNKDVDGLNVSYRKSMWGNNSYIPSKVAAALEILRYISFNIFNKTTVLHGKTKNLKVLKNLIALSNYQNTDINGNTIVIETNPETPNEALRSIVLDADILITECGVPKYFKGDMVKKGCYIIDLSSNHKVDHKGKTYVVGDVDIASVKGVAAGVTPVPNGIGPLSIAMLCKHTLMASNFNLENKSFF